MFDKFVAKIIARRIINKIGLQEGTAMETKKWWQSKTLWAAITFVAISGIEAISAAAGHPVTVPPFVKEVLIGLGLYGLRTAEKPIA